LWNWHAEKAELVNSIVFSRLYCIWGIFVIKLSSHFSCVFITIISCETSVYVYDMFLLMKVCFWIRNFACA